MPTAKLIVEFPDGVEMTLWVKDVKIDPPGMEQDMLDMDSYLYGPMKPQPSGLIRMTDGRIEATITDGPDGKIPAYKTFTKDTRREAETNLAKVKELEKQLKEAEERREKWRTEALLLRKNKAALLVTQDSLELELKRAAKENQTLKAEMEDIIQRKEKKSFTPYATLRKEDWQVLDNAILMAARSRLREWKEDPIPEKETRLPWIERPLKRAIEWCVDAVLWIW